MSASTSPSASTYMISSQFSTSYHATSSDEEEIASLPSDTSSESDFLSEYENSDAEEQWRESLQQLELLLTMVLVPFIGKYAGRRCAYWGRCCFSLIRRLYHFAYSYISPKLGWTKFMEWKYPVEVVITNKVAFRTAGVVGAATL